jgi:hypothetical protein
MQQIMAYQIMSLPALALDGKVISTGKILTPPEIIDLLQA